MWLVRKQPSVQIGRHTSNRPWAASSAQIHSASSIAQCRGNVNKFDSRTRMWVREKERKIVGWKDGKRYNYQMIVTIAKVGLSQQSGLNETGDGVDTVTS